MIDNDLMQLCKKLYQLNKRYKIEYDDLLQQANLYLIIIIKIEHKINKVLNNQYKLKRIEKKLYKYIYKWKKNPLSRAGSWEKG